MSTESEVKTPQHVGIIMDGNGRWAKKRLLPRASGHSAGMKNMVSLAGHAKESGVKYLTVYALSTENLSRPQNELDKLYSLIEKYFTSYVKELIEKGARIKVIGDLSLIPEGVKNKIEEGLALSPESADFTFTLAIAYGSRTEIISAVNSAVKGGKEVTEEEFSSMLYTGGMPYPDLIIRTGGEVRLSNFLLFQAAYAELYFTDVLFPDFDGVEFDHALAVYSSRVRKFGKV